MINKVRFLHDSRYEEWKKGEIAEIVKILVTSPLNQNTIYILKLQDHFVWATNKDVDLWNQLSLF